VTRETEKGKQLWKKVKGKEEKREMKDYRKAYYTLRDDRRR